MKLLMLTAALAAAVAALFLNAEPDPDHPAIVHRRPAAYPPRVVLDPEPEDVHRVSAAHGLAEARPDERAVEVAAETEGRVRWALASITPDERSALIRHQKNVRENIGYFTGERSFEDPSTYGTAAWALAHVSLYSIFDAEGRTMTSAERSALPPDVRKTMEKNAEITFNGTGIYILQRGEFPVLDEVNDLLKEHDGDVPPDLLPYAELVELAELALSYRIK